MERSYTVPKAEDLKKGDKLYRYVDPWAGVPAVEEFLVVRAGPKELLIEWPSTHGTSRLSRSEIDADDPTHDCYATSREKALELARKNLEAAVKRAEEVVHNVKAKLDRLGRFEKERK